LQPNSGLQLNHHRHGALGRSSRGLNLHAAKSNADFEKVSLVLSVMKFPELTLAEVQKRTPVSFINAADSNLFPQAIVPVGCIHHENCEGYPVSVERDTVQRNMLFSAAKFSERLYLIYGHF
jgi:hypothetical protein